MINISIPDNYRGYNQKDEEVNKDKVNYCPYCGSVLNRAYIRNTGILRNYKTCDNDKCDFKLEVP